MSIVKVRFDCDDCERQNRRSNEGKRRPMQPNAPLRCGRLPLAPQGVGAPCRPRKHRERDEPDGHMDSNMTSPDWIESSRRIVDGIEFVSLPATAVEAMRRMHRPQTAFRTVKAIHAASQRPHHSRKPIAKQQQRDGSDDHQVPSAKKREQKRHLGIIATNHGTPLATNCANLLCVLRVLGVSK
jgi:hypothetical protein